MLCSHRLCTVEGEVTPGKVFPCLIDRRITAQSDETDAISMFQTESVNRVFLRSRLGPHVYSRRGLNV